MPRDALASALEGMTLPPLAPMPPDAPEPAPPASDVMQGDSETPQPAAGNSGPSRRLHGKTIVETPCPQ
eukprot:6329645-Pyramimonas_sp.AAC.1